MEVKFNKLLLINNSEMFGLVTYAFLCFIKFRFTISFASTAFYVHHVLFAIFLTLYSLTKTNINVLVYEFSLFSSTREKGSYQFLLFTCIWCDKNIYGILLPLLVFCRKYFIKRTEEQMLTYLKFTFILNYG